MIKIGTNFLFCFSSRAMLHFRIKCHQLAQRYTWDLLRPTLSGQQHGRP